MKNYILITGATAGFGEACAKLFAQNNWNLIITGRRKERLDALSEELSKSFGVEVLTLNFDVRNQSDVQKAIAEIPQTIKDKISILINNAAWQLDEAL